MLASECAKSLDDLASAFVRFEKIRRPRVKKIMQLSNNKLVKRGIQMLVPESDIEYEAARDLLNKYGSVRNAINND